MKMYVVLDKEKPGIGSIRILNLTEVRSTTVQVAKCSFKIITYVKA
jgi:hypothetical protein